MILSIRYEGAFTDAEWDALVERVHLCTPLISLQAHGRLYAGLDDMHGLRLLVRERSCAAAIAPTRHDALLQSCVAVPGRVDVHASADDVQTGALVKIRELEIIDDDVERLRLFGLDTIGALRNLQERHLRAQFGERGSQLYHFLHERNTTPPAIYVPPASVCVDERFDDPQNEPGVILAALSACIDRATGQLGARRTCRIEVAALDRSDTPIARRSRILRESTNTRRVLHTHFTALMRELLECALQWWGLRIRMASISPPRGEQTSIFVPRKTPQDIISVLMPRYEHVLRRVEIRNPWSVIPEHFGGILSIRRNDAE